MDALPREHCKSCGELGVELFRVGVDIAEMGRLGVKPIEWDFVSPDAFARLCRRHSGALYVVWGHTDEDLGQRA